MAAQPHLCRPRSLVSLELTARQCDAILAAAAAYEEQTSGDRSKRRTNDALDDVRIAIGLARTLQTRPAPVGAPDGPRGPGSST